MTQKAVEIVHFRLRSDVSEADFLQATAKADGALRCLDGFISRHVSRDKNGNWIDYVLWESMTEALDAAQVFHTLPDAQEFCGMLDMSQARVSHLSLVHDA
jgi:hypothetical protein